MSELKVSAEQFEEYREIQESGMYNMFDPQARMMTSLDKKEWIYILQNYEILLKTYEGK
tara:strand:- start:921 stop:1097 length:177 start_codon:yes stop_codon:yes gene_type:complete